MDFNLFSLRVFLKVAEKQSFTKAAEQLLISQPAVSSQIRKLEDYFLVPLVVRKHSGVFTLTEAGEKLRSAAEALLKHQDRLFDKMEEYTGVAVRRLNIGACFIAGEHLLPAGLKTFRERHPEIDATVTITKSETVFDGLLSGAFEVGITGLRPKQRFIVKQKLFEAPLVLFEAARNRSSPRLTSLRELHGLEFVLREEGAGCTVQFERFLSKNGMSFKDLNIVSVSESNEAIKNMVRNKGGVSLFPRFMVEKEIEQGIFGEILLREGKMKQTFYLLYRKGDTLHRNLERFIDVVTDAITSG